MMDEDVKNVCVLNCGKRVLVFFCVPHVLSNLLWFLMLTFLKLFFFFFLDL